MKSLCKRSALASALLFSACGVQAASMDFETSDSDTIVVGATAEKVTLRVTGYKNLPAQANAPMSAKLGTYYVSTSSSVGQLAVTYGPEHNPTAKDYKLLGTLTNGNGENITASLASDTGSNPSHSIAEIDGIKWAVLPAGTTFNGGIYTHTAGPLPAGVYPITLRAALYQP